MGNHNRSRMTVDELRQEAERRLLERHSATTANLSEAELRALVRELQIRQIELEIHNEELQRTQAAADATAGKQMESLLRDSEGQSHLLMDSIPAYISYVDADERYRWVNRAYELWYCRSRSEIIGRKIAEIQQVDHYQKMQPYIRQALAGSKVHYENTVTTSEGTSQTFDTNYIPHAADDGTILGFIVLVFDITERKLLERSLRLTQFSIDHAVDSVFWVAPDATILYVNEAACQTLGCSREEIVGKTVPDIDPNFPPEAWPAHWEEIRQRKSFSFDSDHYTKTGELIHTEVTVNYLVFEGHEYNCAMMRNITERKEAETYLAQLAAIVTSSEDAIISKTLDGRITSWNESAQRLFGYTEAEMIGTPVTRLFPPDRIDEEMEILCLIHAGKRVEHLETVRLRKDGTPVHVSVTISPIKDAAGQIIGASKTVRDITKRRRVEDALRESEQRFQAFMDQSPVVAWLKDENYKFRYVNKALESLFNLPADQILGRTDYDLYDKHEADITRANDERVLASGTILQDIEQVKGADGRMRQWLVQKFPLRRTEHPTWTGGTAVDVTERYKTEKELLESHERFRLVFEGAKDPIIWADADTGILIECNRAAETLLGRDQAEIIGQHYSILHHPEIAQRFRKAFEERASGDCNTTVEIEVLHKDGRRIAVLVSPSLTMIEGQRILQGIFQDITERKRAEESLREKEQLLSQSQRIAKVGSFSTDLATKRITWTEEKYRLYGVSPETFVPTVEAILQLMHPDDRKNMRLRLQAMFTGLAYGPYEFRVPQSDGTVRFLSGQSEVICDKTGQPVRIIGTAQDITERRLAEAAIREGDRNFSALFEQSAICVGQIDSRTGRFLRVNPYYCELLGYSLEEMLHLDFQTITHPDDLQPNLDNMARLRSGEQRTFQMEKRLLRKDGVVVWVRLTVVPLWAENSPITCHLAFVEDITQRILAETERRKSEEELRRSEERFSKLYAVSPVSILVATFPEGKIVEVNEAFTQLFGYEAADVLGKTAAEIKIWADLAEREVMLEQLRRDGSLRNRETVFHTKSGAARTVLFSVELIELDGELHSLAMSIDITARKQADEALRQSEERYQLVMSGVNDGIWDWNVLTGKAYVSPRHHEILGLPHDELLVDIDSFFDAVHPEDRSAVETAVQRHFEQNERYEIELRARRPDGSYRWILSRGESIRNAAGKPIRMLGSITDITQRKQAEEALRESEQRYRTFIETCADSVYLLDTAGNIRSANPAALRMHGYTLDELLGMNIRDLNDPANFLLVEERLHRIQAGGALQFETVHQRKDGTTFPTEVRATPVTIGNEMLILAFDRDISQRKSREEQNNLLREELAYTSRLVTLREMASGLAHELNQPLTALSLYIGSAMELAAQYNSTALNECLRRIAKQLQHSGEIIRSMRSFAKRSTSQSETIDIDLLINDVLGLLAGEIKRSGTITKLELDPQLSSIFTNGTQVKQVLVNLIRNAIEAMSESNDSEHGRALVIKTEVLQNVVRVSVSDTGPGLDSAIAKRLFLPFQTTKPEGLGMGLAICRTLIEALGGQIGLRSSSASGTTFCFELPKSTAPISV